MGPLEKTQSVGIVGAGTMGSGIAQLAARAGHRVVLFERRRRRVRFLRRSGSKRNRKDLWRAASSREKKLVHLSRSLPRGDTIGDLAGCGLVIEAIVEDLDVKRQALRRSRGYRLPRKRFWQPTPLPYR